MKTKLTQYLWAALLWAALTTALVGQPTAFTYQGRLTENGDPASGIFDLRFTIYDVDVGGAAVTGPITISSVLVSNGLFTVALDFGASAFNGSDRWLEIEVVTSGGGAFVPLTPRQRITSLPYAIKAVHAMAVNMGTISDPTFIGTTTTAPLELSVNDEGALRLESTPGSPNIIGGVPGNGAAPGNEGVTIAGGGLEFYPNTVDGDYSSIGGGTFNRILGEWATIGGGRDNRAYSDYATVSGGFANFVDTNAIAGAVAGGQGNRVTGQHSTISGGVNNLNTGLGATIGGGNGNRTAANDTAIPGGANNRIEAGSNQSTIGGGWGNFMGSNSLWSTIGGGWNNMIVTNASSALIGGGEHNRIQSGASSSVIGGGADNEIQTGALSAAISGGAFNRIEAEASAASIGGGSQNSIGATSPYGTIGGGLFNNIGTNSYASTVSGGDHNEVDDESLQSTIAGGRYNLIQCFLAGTVGGGLSNRVSRLGSYSTVGGGENNLASSQWASIAGGRNNIASGHYATVAGGFENEANGQTSLAAGNGAQAIHDGSFVWADSSGAGFASTGANQFNVRAGGGVRLETSGAGVTVDGASVLAGTVPASALSGTYSSAVTFNNPANSFSGSGANLTALDASELTSGTVPSDRIAGGYASIVSFANPGNSLFGTFYGNQADSAASPAHTWIGTDSDTGMFRAGNNTLAFSTGGAEQVRLTDAGRVGIGTTAPAAPLHVIGGTDTSVSGGGHLVLGNTNSISLSMDGNEIMARNNGGYSILFLNADGGNVTIGSASPDTNYTLRVNGSVAGVGAYNNISDARYKQNIRQLDGALEAVLHLRGVSFDWRQDEYPEMNFEDRRQVGFVAQELAEVLPEAVSSDTQGTLSVAYTKVVPVLVEAIKEQTQRSQASIQKLREENSSLRQELEELKRMVAALVRKGDKP